MHRNITNNREKFCDEIFWETAVLVGVLLAALCRPLYDIKHRRYEKSSSAVADRPRDTSCLSVVTFNSRPS